MATAARRRCGGRHQPPRRFRALPRPHLIRAGESTVPQLPFECFVVLKLQGRKTVPTRPTLMMEHPHCAGVPQLLAQATAPRSPIKVFLGTKVPGRVMTPAVMVLVVVSPGRGTVPQDLVEQKGRQLSTERTLAMELPGCETAPTVRIPALKRLSCEEAPPLPVESVLTLRLGPARSARCLPHLRQPRCR